MSRTAGAHPHRWYEISRSEDDRALEACSVPNCIETRVVQRTPAYTGIDFDWSKPLDLVITDSAKRSDG